ncbi:MAG: dihydrolipoyllysine-residue succinyltransferase [Rhodospirillaceae bacterium]|nr:dihydrolipoyllysine-residue succinyltransferase [Rhodospirillaceae bacterium]
MSTEIKVPQLGESVTEATIAKWLKKTGDNVNIDEPLLELETDKVTLEVNAPGSGQMGKILVEEGNDVSVGETLAFLNEGVQGKPQKPSQLSAVSQENMDRASREPIEMAAPVSKSLDVKLVSGYPLAPSVRRLVDEHMLDPGKILATGKHGRLTKADVLLYVASGVEGKSVAVVPDRGPREEHVKMSRLRRSIADRLKEAQNTAAMLTTFNEVDMSAVINARKSYQDSFVKKNGVKLGFMAFFIKASISALKELPSVNASVADNHIIYKNYYDIGVAVGTPQGLVVPVIRDCDVKGFAEIEADIAGYGRKARDGKLTVNEMTGGTFTISNGGIYGSMLSTPILNSPQSAILGMHNIKQRAVVLDDGTIVARPMMYLALSYDHRIIDGREAVTFLVRLKECLEDPERILYEV